MRQTTTNHLYNQLLKVLMMWEMSMVSVMSHVCLSAESTAEVVQDASDNHQPPVQPIVESTNDVGDVNGQLSHVFLSAESTAEILQEASDDHQPPVQPIVESTNDVGDVNGQLTHVCLSAESTAEILQDASDDHQPPLHPIVNVCTSTTNHSNEPDTTNVSPKRKKPKYHDTVNMCDEFENNPINAEEGDDDDDGEENDADNLFQCPECPKNFKFKSWLSRHAIMHERYYPCTYCTKTYKKKSELQFHILAHTGQKRFKCPDCYASYNDLSNQIKHWNLKHNPETKQYECDRCGETFTCARYLRYHNYAHDGVHPYKCDICGMEFSSPSFLSKHRKKKAHNVTMANFEQYLLVWSSETNVLREKKHQKWSVRVLFQISSFIKLCKAFDNICR
ncbi:zinc finger protein 70-like [Metopolophium dirhodum]|uniref:zinc finger protein 70-like n=1 Tax=Metopolophium dirhodum TaxID=44670 RepID=UPI00298F4C66|nr:zinc finger protein 70-like [Metopolophium dirhodum]